MVKNKKVGKFSSFLNRILPPKNIITEFQKLLTLKLIFLVDLINVIDFCLAFWEAGEPIRFSNCSEELFFNFLKL